MAGDPDKRIAHALARERDFVLRGEITESSAHVVPLAEQKLASAVSLMEEAARRLIEDGGLQPEEPVDPKWPLSPALASRGLQTERGRLLHLAQAAQRNALRVVGMVR